MDNDLCNFGERVMDQFCYASHLAKPLELGKTIGVGTESLYREFPGGLVLQLVARCIYRNLVSARNN